MNNVNQQIKLVRETLKLSQDEFATNLGLKRNTISLIENGKRNPSDRTLNDICRKYNISDEWLKNGDGDMFNHNNNNLIEELSSEYSLDNLDVKILKTYLELSEDRRSVIKDYAKELLSSFNDENSATVQNDDSDIDEELAAYRQELEAEKKGIISSASGE